VLDQIKSTLIKVRLEQAHECLDSAEREKEASSFRASVNRSYYCVFHAMRALLVFPVLVLPRKKQ